MTRIPTTLAAAAAADRLDTSLLRAAAEWRLLGLLFSCPTWEWREQVASLAAEVGADDVTAAAATALNEADEGLYHSIFGPGGPAPPREVTYRQATLSGAFLAELAAYYQAFGYRAAGSEPLDHVSVEADFVAFLLLKQAFALSNQQRDQAAITARAAQSFIDEHLSNIAGPLAESIPASGIGYLQGAAQALAARTGPPQQRAQVQLDSPTAGTLPLLSTCSFEGDCDSFEA